MLSSGAGKKRMRMQATQSILSPDSGSSPESQQGELRCRSWDGPWLRVNYQALGIRMCLCSMHESFLLLGLCQTSHTHDFQQVTHWRDKAWFLVGYLIEYACSLGSTGKLFLAKLLAMMLSSEGQIVSRCGRSACSSTRKTQKDQKMHCTRLGDPHNQWSCELIHPTQPT